jgi:hypothetical protein
MGHACLQFLEIVILFVFQWNQNKYVGEEKRCKGMQLAGSNIKNKTLSVRDVRISFSIWDAGGKNSKFLLHN